MLCETKIHMCINFYWLIPLYNYILSPLCVVLCVRMCVVVVVFVFWRRAGSNGKIHAAESAVSSLARFFFVIQYIEPTDVRRLYIFYLSTLSLEFLYSASHPAVVFSSQPSRSVDKIIFIYSIHIVHLSTFVLVYSTASMIHS